MSKWENNGKLSKLWNVIKLGKSNWYTLRYGTIPIQDFEYKKHDYNPIVEKKTYGSNWISVLNDVNEKTGKNLRYPVVNEIITMIERIKNGKMLR